MRAIERTGQFKRDFKRELKGQHRSILDNDFTEILTALADDQPAAHETVVRLNRRYKLAPKLDQISVHINSIPVLLRYQSASPDTRNASASAVRVKPSKNNIIGMNLSTRPISRLLILSRIGLLLSPVRATRTGTSRNGDA